MPSRPGSASPALHRQPCGDRVCGTVDDGCGTPVQCGADNGNCPAAAECKAAGVCGNDGQCSYPDEPDNTPCHMNKCTHTCQSGVCTDTPVVCPDDTPCQTYTCDPNDGTCSATDKVCPPAPECQSGPGVCDAQTGECSYTDSPDDTPCGMNKCKNTCQGGVCTRTRWCARTRRTTACSDLRPELREPVWLSPNPGRMAFRATVVLACASTAHVKSRTTGRTPAPAQIPVSHRYVRQCSETCVCYSTVEGAGFCIDRDQAICPTPASGQRVDE